MFIESLSTSLSVWTPIHTNTHTYTHTNTRIHRHIHIQTHAYTYIYTYKHTHTQTYTHTNTHIHTHTHIPQNYQLYIRARSPTCLCYEYFLFWQCLWQMDECNPYEDVCCKGMKCANAIGSYCRIGVEKCYCVPISYGKALPYNWNWSTDDELTRQRQTDSHRFHARTHARRHKRHLLNKTASKQKQNLIG